MAETEGPLLEELGDRLSATADQLAHLAKLRWRLAEIELRQSARSGKRLAVAIAIAVVVSIMALVVLVVAACDWLDNAAPLGEVGWALPVGLAMAAAGPAIGCYAWRRFRREFRGLEQSIEELREDVVWLREWAGRAEEELETPKAT